MKYTFVGVLGLIFMAGAFIPTAQAQAIPGTPQETISFGESLVRKIKALMEQVELLQAQLQEVRVEAGVASATFKQDLREGMTNEDIKNIQEILASDPTIYPEGKVTSYFGLLTKKAIMRFQTRYNLAVTGTIDAETRAYLEAYLNERRDGKIPKNLLQQPETIKKIELQQLTTCNNAVGTTPETLCKKLKIKYDTCAKQQEVKGITGTSSINSSIKKDACPKAPLAPIDRTPKDKDSRSLKDTSFIFLGSVPSQFSDADLKFMAETYPKIFFSKFHMRGEVNGAEEATKKLVAYNPDVQVFPYFGSKFRFSNPRLQYDEENFKSEWYLKDKKTGEPIPLEEKQQDGYYVDLSNPEYRKFAVGVIRSWMDEAPYAGIFLDSADPIGVGSNPAYVQKWVKRVGQHKIDKWNEGLALFIRETKEALGDKEVIYNGFSPADIRINRNLDKLTYAAGSFNEDFCIDRSSGTAQPESLMFEDIALMQKYGTKILVEQVNYPVAISAADKTRMGRYCLGAFLLGEQPGYTFFKFARRGYGGDAHQVAGGITAHITENPPESALKLGTPRAIFSRDDHVGYRAFSNGYVYVNFNAKASQKVTLPSDLVLMNDAVQGKKYRAGEVYSIPPQEAALFLYPSKSE